MHTHTHNNGCIPLCAARQRAHDTRNEKGFFLSLSLSLRLIDPYQCCQSYGIVRVQHPSRTVIFICFPTPIALGSDFPFAVAGLPGDDARAPVVSVTVKYMWWERGGRGHATAATRRRRGRRHRRFLYPRKDLLIVSAQYYTSSRTSLTTATLPPRRKHRPIVALFNNATSPYPSTQAVGRCVTAAIRVPQIRRFPVSPRIRNARFVHFFCFENPYCQK